MRRVLIGFLAIATTSCVTVGGLDTWEKQGATTTDFHQAASQCKAQAMASAAPMVLGNSVYSACMEGKGWHSKDTKA